MRSALALMLTGSLLAISGCASSDQSSGPVSGVQDTTLMTPKSGIADAWSYTDPKADLRKYKKLMIGPAQVYSGPEADFADLPAPEVEKIAQMLPEEAKNAVKGHYPVVTKPGPDVVRLNFILVKVEETVPYVSTLTRIIPIGAVMNLGKAAAGSGGTLTGALTVVVEAFDSETGELVASAQRRVSPAAFDLEATMGTEETARAVAKQIGLQLLDRLDEIRAG